MKLLFDLTSLGQQPTGIHRVATNVAKTFIKIFPEYSYELVFFREIPSYFPINELSASITVSVLDGRYKVMRLIKLPRLMKKSDADWIICCAEPGPLALWDKRVISVVHDLVCWKFPETMLWQNRIKWRSLIRHAIKTNTYILNDSETVKLEVQEKFHNTNSYAISIGIDVTSNEDREILKKFSLEKDRYLLSVATLEPRKNLSVILEAFQMIKNDSGLKLVLTGGKGWKFQDSIGAGEDNASGNIIFTGYVSDSELNALYNNARLFISASVYEGFGLPVIESIQHDLPVLISDIPVYREITSGKAVYFKHYSAEMLYRQLQLCVSEDQRGTESFKELKAYAAQYTYENYVVKLNELLTR